MSSRGQDEAVVDAAADHVAHSVGDVQAQPGSVFPEPMWLDGRAGPKSPPGIVHGVHQLTGPGIQAVVIAWAFTLSMTEFAYR
ncbi:MAG: hypothetical protein M9927_03555 [Anaerolineae bacterium]|nr:hypothetical protein [Anaerolineae bacterium]